MLGLSACATTEDDPLEKARRPDLPDDWWRSEGCTDADTGRYVDAPGQGRQCRGAPRRGRPRDRRERQN